MEHATLNLPRGTKAFANEIPCPYCRGILNVCKKPKDKEKPYKHTTSIPRWNTRVMFLGNT